jgi:hypothetical protein
MPAALGDDLRDLGFGEGDAGSVEALGLWTTNAAKGRERRERTVKL